MTSSRYKVAALAATTVCVGAIGLAQSDGVTGGVPKNATLIYVGSRTSAKGQGISVFRLQSAGTEVFQNVTLVPLGLAVETPNPIHLETDAKRRRLFAANDVATFDGKAGGAVSAFSIDPSGKLTLLNQRHSMGANPCQLALDKEGQNLLVANCGSGAVAVFPVATDGRLGEATTVVQDAGRGVTLDPAGGFAFVCDPTSDRVRSFRFDAKQGKLTATEAVTTLKPGSSPRQIVFRPDGKFAYVVNEKDSTITSFAYDAATGKLTGLQTVSTVPEYFDGTNLAGEAGMHRSGKYLFVSNRGHNSVVLFLVDRDNGTLTYVEEQGTGGKNPRHFGIEPAGKHMAIANEDSDTVLGSRIDEGNGRLKPSGIFAEVPAPAFVEFLPPPEGGK